LELELSGFDLEFELELELSGFDLELSEFELELSGLKLELSGLGYMRLRFLMYVGLDGNCIPSCC